eukprot:m.10117 g.10117  ORF g.10117 m.10117 type:complete len:99 (+) comp9583_c0_seq1:32-328(+)
MSYHDGFSILATAITASQLQQLAHQQQCVESSFAKRWLDDLARRLQPTWYTLVRAPLADVAIRTSCCLTLRRNPRRPVLALNTLDVIKPKYQVLVAMS